MPSLADLSDPKIELGSAELQADSLPTELSEKSKMLSFHVFLSRLYNSFNEVFIQIFNCIKN